MTAPTAASPPATASPPTAARPAIRHLTQELLAGVTGTHRAVVTATEPGLVAGLDLLDQTATHVPTGRWEILVGEGAEVDPGQAIVSIVGTAAELAAAEDHVLGPLGYAGGIARRCRELRGGAPDGLRIACGGWKKLPAALKPLLRAGLTAGGVTPRLVEGMFVYVDKNVARLLGGVEATVAAATRLDHGPVAVQVTSLAEAQAAASAGAGIVMVDTGDLAMLDTIDTALRRSRRRDRIVLAFAGGVTADDLGLVRRAGADVVDLGRTILDAPLWDLHVEIVT